MRFGDLIVRPFKKTLALGLWETATCFAARISTLFPSSSAEEFWHTVGLPFRRISAGDREAIRALAYFTAADETALLRSSPETLGKSYLRIGNEIITTQDYVRGSYPICPDCAEEDIAARPDLNPDQAVFGRLEWHATSVRTCRRHQRSLVDARADLAVGIAYHDFGFRTSSALNDLSSLRARSIERPTTPYEDYFVDRLHGEAKSIEILSGMKLHQVSRGCLAFGTLKLFGPRAARSRMTEDEKRAAWQEGFSILARGEAGIAELLRQVLLNSGKRHTRSYTPMGTLGPVFEWLNYGAADEALSELKRVVAAEVFRTFPMAGGEVFLGSVNANPRMHTIHDVQRRYGVSWLTVKRIGQLAGVLSDLVEGGPKVMTAKDAERLFERIDDVVSLPVLAKELGASMKQIAMLADRGLLKPAFESAEVVSFRREDVDAFVQRLVRDASPVAQRDEGQATVYRVGYRSAERFVAAIEAILDGRAGMVHRLSSLRLFHGLLVDRQTLSGIIISSAGRRGNAPWRVKASQIGLAAHLVAARWKVKPEAVVGLKRDGHLKGYGNGGRQGSTIAIPHKAVAHFEARYISLALLADHHGVGWKTMRSQVNRRKVPLAFEGIRGCFYSRKALKRATLL